MGKRLYVGNLPYSIQEPQLRTLFEQDGRKVTEVKIVTDRETGRPRGFAFVEMSTDDEAAVAITTLHGADVGGRTITVNEARERAPRGAGGGYGGGGGGFGAPRGPRPLGGGPGGASGGGYGGGPDFGAGAPTDRGGRGRERGGRGGRAGGRDRDRDRNDRDDEGGY